MDPVINSKHDQTAEDYKIRFLNSEKVHICSCASLYPPHLGGKSFNGISLLNNQFCFLQKSRQGFLKLENSFVFPTRKCFIVFDKNKYIKWLILSTPRSRVILLTVCHTILKTLVRRIWYSSPILWLIFFFILITYLLILYWYCKEKFCLGHWWELKG